MAEDNFNIGPQYLEDAPGVGMSSLDTRPRTMFRVPMCTNIDELDADVAFIGMPFDQGTFGPAGRAVRP